MPNPDLPDLAGHPLDDAIGLLSHVNPSARCEDPAGKEQGQVVVCHDARRAATTAGIAVIAGMAVMVRPSMMKSSIVSAWKSGGGKKPSVVLIVGRPATSTV